MISLGLAFCLTPLACPEANPVYHHPGIFETGTLPLTRFDHPAALMEDQLGTASGDLLSTGQIDRSAGFQAGGGVAPAPLSADDRRALAAMRNDYLRAARMDMSDTFGALNTGSSLTRELDRFYLESSRGPRDPQDVLSLDRVPTVVARAAPRSRARWGPGPGSTQGGLELGSLGLEAMKPVLLASDFLTGTLPDLRRMMFVEEPQTSIMLMMDGASGHTVVLNSPNTLIVPTRQLTGPPAMVDIPTTGPLRDNPRLRIEADRPFLLVAWDLATTRVAFVLYGIFLICWASWRYVISRYA